MFSCSLAFFAGRLIWGGFEASSEVPPLTSDLQPPRQLFCIAVFFARRLWGGYEASLRYDLRSPTQFFLLCRFVCNAVFLRGMVLGEGARRARGYHLRPPTSDALFLQCRFVAGLFFAGWVVWGEVARRARGYHLRPPTQFFCSAVFFSMQFFLQCGFFCNAVFLQCSFFAG